MHLRDLCILIIDCQTTGSSPQTDHPIEVSWQITSASALEPHLPNRSWVALPGGSTLSPRIQALTGVNEQDLENAPSAQEVWKQLLKEATHHKPEPPRYLVAHYARFETGFLLPWHREQTSEEVLPWDVVCTHQLARRCLPHLSAYGIRALSGFFGSCLSHKYQAAAHVNATRVIWKGLVESLTEIEVFDTGDLRSFLSHKKGTSARKREFLVSRPTRQQLPDGAGIYRMLAPDGTVLYVGKATSLKKRVSSYFKSTGRLRLGEMMAQVASVSIHPTATVLEAALAETDEIKHFDPPYNSSLKAGRRALWYYSTEFTQSAKERSVHFPWGPFPSAFVFLPLECVLKGRAGNQVTEFFPRLEDSALFLKGLQRVFPTKLPSSVRDLLIHGLRLLRIRSDHLVPALGEERKTDDSEWTEELVEASIRRKLIRAGQALHVCRWLWRLSHCYVLFPSLSGSLRLLEWRQGQITRRDWITEDQAKTLDPPVLPATPFGFDLAAYDRLRILLSELRRENEKTNQVQVGWGLRRWTAAGKPFFLGEKVPSNHAQARISLSRLSALSGMGPLETRIIS